MLIASPAVLSAQWQAQNSGTTTFIKSICFIDENKGWACGDDIVIRTTDGGDTWSSSTLTGENSYLYFMSEDLGWITSSQGRIYHTTNGGDNWTTQSTGTMARMTNLYFKDQNNGIAVGWGETVRKTTNGGVTWTNTFDSTGFLDFFASQMINDNTYYIAGTNGTLYRTGNGGNSWDLIQLPVSNPFFSIKFLNPTTGWIFGCCGMYFRTTDGGNNWTSQVDLTEGFNIYSSSFVNDTLGWVCADAGYIMRTHDAGTTWDSLYSGTTVDLRSVSFVNENTGWVAGYNGIILKTTNGGGPAFTNIQTLSSEIPDNYNLSQNYPNPFNPETKINFAIPVSSFVKLTVYDALGREVSKLVNGSLKAGTYEFNFNAEELNSGIYFYRLETESFARTRKMLLIK